MLEDQVSNSVLVISVLINQPVLYLIKCYHFQLLFFFYKEHNLKCFHCHFTHEVIWGRLERPSALVVLVLVHVDRGQDRVVKAPRY